MSFISKARSASLHANAQPLSRGGGFSACRSVHPIVAIPASIVTGGGRTAHEGIVLILELERGLAITCRRL